MHRTLRWRCVHLTALALTFATVALTAAAPSLLDTLDVYQPDLPAVVAITDAIDDLELRVYLPADVTTSTSYIAASSVHVTPTSSTFTFAPSSFVFTPSESVVHFRASPLATGTATIEFIASDATSNATIVLFAQAIEILLPPVSFAPTDVNWHGVILLNDSFDELPPPTDASQPSSSSLWSDLVHGYPSSACGAFDGNQALYFTALGDRFAMTTALELHGFHGKMHFHHVYGAQATQTYDATGDNRISCERVDANEETTFSYLPQGQDATNASAWQALLQVPLGANLETFPNAFAAYSVQLPPAAMHATTQFRWQQTNHSSFPLDVAPTWTPDDVLAIANDRTSVNGQLGHYEQAQWHYRNLFDQWAIDNVRLEVRLNAPLFVLVDNDVVGSAAVHIESLAPRSWVAWRVGDGAHAFPTCLEDDVAQAQTAIALLTVSGYVHAIACLRTADNTLISSFPARSMRVRVQAQAPQLTSVVDTTTSIDVWRVTLACDTCSFMRFTQTTDSDVVDKQNSPSCAFATRVDARTHVVTVTSNAQLHVVACGDRLDPSDVVASAPYRVQPRAPMFVFDTPDVTTTRFVNVTIVPIDAALVRIVFVVGTDDNVALPDCSWSSSSIEEENQSVTIDVRVSDVVRAIACCTDRRCDDSDVSTWGPLRTVRAVAPVVTTACSRTRPQTVVVYFQTVTIDTSVRYVVGDALGDDTAAQRLTCSETSGALYDGRPIQVTTNASTVFAISCGAGVQASRVTATLITLDACCAGLDAYTHAACAHVLLFEDTFDTDAACVDAADKWHKRTSQWGGANVNGGVHRDNVACEWDAAINKSVLALTAHGDLFLGSSPIGSERTVDSISDSDSVLREHTVDDSMLQWTLAGASSLPCNGDTKRCAARRVGAAVTTTLALNAGVVVLRLKPCAAARGTLTQLWWGDSLVAKENKQPVPFLSLWKAALAQATTTLQQPFVLTVPSDTSSSRSKRRRRSTSLDDTDGYMELAMQWNATEGRANVYIDGVLVEQQQQLTTTSSSDASVTSQSLRLNQSLSLGVWFPNTLAGDPYFATCRVLVDSARVFALEVAGGRWCDIVGRESGDDGGGDAMEEERTLQLLHRVRCATDADCRAAVTQDCFMDVYEAVCIPLHDELAGVDDVDMDATSATLNDDENDDGIHELRQPTNQFCHFRLAPAAHSRGSTTDMSDRTQRRVWPA